MRRSGLGPAAVAAAMVMVLASCGGGATASTGATGGEHGPGSATTPAATTTASSSQTASGTLSVHPAAAAPSAEFTFSFIAPESAGIHGRELLAYAVTVSGPRGTGCVSDRGAAPAHAVRGQRARVVLGPAELGAMWCPGAYTARAEEFARAACRAGELCPQYVRLVGEVGQVAFTVTRG